MELTYTCEKSEKETVELAMRATSGWSRCVRSPRNCAKGLMGSEEKFGFAAEGG